MPDLKNLPLWKPTPDIIAAANITQFMASLNMQDVKTFHAWTCKEYEHFWAAIIEKLNIPFKKNPTRICDLSAGIEVPYWLPGAEMNIADSCLHAEKSATAILCAQPDGRIEAMSYGELEAWANRIANSLMQHGFKAGDTIGIAMPMHAHAVAIYLGIIKMGGVVVSIADSFSTEEIATRLNIARAQAIFTQDEILWAGKKLNLYGKVSAIPNIKSIVLSFAEKLNCELKNHDLAWADFLVEDTTFTSLSCTAMTTCNILFSSGTTATPKAIPWLHSTPIKVASDAYFHQNIKAHDVLCWPTNLGWMMGPWLIFAALMHRATIALFPDAPKDARFGQFVQDAKVTMLGVVPTLVAHWRQTKCMENLNWQAIKVFSSSGECSNPQDMAYLMQLGGHKPIIEYCGGTEIGGSYISSTVVQDNFPALFSTPVMGIDFMIMDEEGHHANIGEIAIIPPSIGLSNTLLNADHQHIYYDGMPLIEGKILRRHGDQIEQYANGYYSILGRVDDTMNLGGIKVSAAEIERALVGIENIRETAAIAVQPQDNGPSLLVIFAATNADLNKEEIKKLMQKKINANLNPLFKIHDVICVNELPKTASNKIMRRMLRKQYQRL